MMAERRRSTNQPQPHPPAPSTTSPPLSERPERPVNSPQASHSAGSCHDGNPESLPRPHRYAQVSAVELTDEVIYNILRKVYYEHEVEPIISFFGCITRHLWYHRQRPAIPPLSLGVDLALLEISTIK
jgi:hypothetical protein